MLKTLGALSAALTLSLALPAAGSAAFRDDFNGTGIDSANWVTQHSTSGRRWCADDALTHWFGSGAWLDVSQQPCHGLLQAPPYGSIGVGSGLASLSAGLTLAFPYIYTQADPFPATGDFRLDVRMRFDSVGPHGVEFAAQNWPDPTPDGDNAFGKDPVFLLAADSSGHPPRIDLLGVQYYLPDAGNLHTYTLRYVAGAYSVYVDSDPTPVLGPIASTKRPNMMLAGNPTFTFWGFAPWTSMTLDCVTTAPDNTDGCPGGAPPVLTPVQQLQQLVNLVAGMALGGIGNALTAKLDAALAAAQAGDVPTACATLSAFENQVRAQTGKALTAAQASDLLDRADQASTALGC